MLFRSIRDPRACFDRQIRSLRNLRNQRMTRFARNARLRNVLFPRQARLRQNAEFAEKPEKYLDVCSAEFAEPAEISEGEQNTQKRRTKSEGKFIRYLFA